MAPITVLKETFGYENFRPGQKELIDNMLAGRDSIGIMPTGAGKSILLDALGLALGARAESRLVRTGSDGAVVSA
ncbi:MAG: hypothetical protein ACOC4H_03385, partial [bacterium]